MESGNRWLTVILLGGLLLGIFFCLVRIATTNPSPNEALLLSLILTILSILGSWVASRYYAEYSFNRSQRLFALKAAEKVLNLSRELDRLSISLQEELKANDYDSPNESLLAKQLKLESAIHVLTTLKTVNDGSLSDWKGVVGEEINAKLENEAEWQEAVRELLDRFESLNVNQVSSPSATDEDRVAAKLREELAALRQDLRSLASQVSGVPVRQSPPRVAKQLIERTCPICGQIVRFRQRPKLSAIKGVKCIRCGAALCSRYIDGEFVLTERKPVSEEIECPVCQGKLGITLDPVPGGMQGATCPSCSFHLRVIRSGQGIKVQPQSFPERTAQEPQLDDTLLERIREAMGSQPWPSGRARSVAENLGLPVSAVARVIKELIRRGVFKVQFDGKLYIPTSATTTEGDSSKV